MALPADFSKIFGSTATGGLTPIGDVNYAKGWEFVGSNPPTKNDFSYLQNLSDLKSQWLYNNKLQRSDPFGDIKSDGAAAIAAALSNLGLGESAKRDVGTGYNQIPDMSYWSSPSGGVNFPNGLQMRFGTVAANGAKTFATPFTNQCYGIVFGQTYASNYWIFSPMYRASDISKTGFAFINRAWSGISGTGAQDAGEPVFYIALGH